MVTAALVALTALVEWNLLRDGLPLSLDSSSQYWPWYVHLGEQLRVGQLPAWNPSAFGGAPFAADPLSGWTYVPAMLLFALLPPDSAIAAFISCHMLLAGASLYALGRLLGLRTPLRYSPRACTPTPGSSSSTQWQRSRTSPSPRGFRLPCSAWSLDFAPRTAARACKRGR